MALAQRLLDQPSASFSLPCIMSRIHIAIQQALFQHHAALFFIALIVLRVLVLAVAGSFVRPGQRHFQLNLHRRFFWSMRRRSSVISTAGPFIPSRFQRSCYGLTMEPAMPIGNAPTEIAFPFILAKPARAKRSSFSSTSAGMVVSSGIPDIAGQSRDRERRDPF